LPGHVGRLLSCIAHILKIPVEEPKNKLPEIENRVILYGVIMRTKVPLNAIYYNTDISVFLAKKAKFRGKHDGFYRIVNA